MEELNLLVARSRAEDLDAYGEIVRRFQGMACGYAYSILGDFHLAEDAAQEAFIEAYRCLGNLREAAAFPGWFRRIVFKHCDRQMRRKQVPTVGLEAAASLASPACSPSQAAEDREMRDRVLAAVRSLPEQDRTVTALFYINGYSQNDIAEFLEVPVGTVKSRLAASRNRLKERILNMVEETLHKNAPDERFSEKVIDELLDGPDLLQLEGHPVSRMWQTIRNALGEYEVIEGDEIVEQSTIVNPWTLQFAYQPSAEKVLRTETIVTVFQAMMGRTPPVRLVTAGRRFWANPEDTEGRRVHHSFTVLCVEARAGREAMEATLRKVLEAAIGPVELRYDAAELPCLEYCKQVLVDQDGRWTGIGLGCGVLSAETLRQAGYDPSEVSGFVFCTDLEKLAMLKHGIDDIHKLWSPPYLQE